MQVETPLDVAIVGAGISGLAVARHLAAADRSVVILEASDRVGGRLHSVDGLDTGATWFWPNEPRVKALIKCLGVPTHQQHLDGNAVYHDPSGAQELQGNPLDVTSSRFSRGADSLARAVERSLPAATVRFDRVVHRVEDGGSRDALTVATGDSTLQVRHVVLAIPPALAAELITFDPPLPDDLQRHAARTPVWMGSITKVVVRYADAFWRRRGLSGSAMSHVGPIRELHDMSGPDGEPAAIFGFAPPAATGAPTVTERQVIDQLVTIFGPEAQYPTDVIIRDWRHEPFTSPPAVERLNAYETYGHELFRRPAMAGRLHWTSTETSSTHPGHIEGALEAAERTATAIVDQLSCNGSEHPA